jgi:antitoxin (DNA-binding transcriptional repressor) of toxin-antitoxin stability system
MKQQFDGVYVKDPTAVYSAQPVKGPVTIPMHEAKSNLSKLVKRAAAGETIYIGAYGKPEAMLIAPEALPKKKPVSEAFGCMRGKIELPEGWDDPLPDDIIESFYSMQGLEDFAVK